MTNVVAIKSSLNSTKMNDVENSSEVSDLTSSNDYWINCLVRIAQKKDQHAFKLLFEFFSPKLKTFYLKHRLSDVQAEELIQETFISVWRFANYFEENKGQVSTWIYTIARNKKLDFFRKNGRQVETTELVTEDWAVQNGNQFDSQMNLELSAFIPQLPEEQQEIIQKVYFEELSHQKAADDLNITLGTVKGRVRSAINNLNKLMRGGK